MKTHFLLLTALLTFTIINGQSMLSTNEFQLDPIKSTLKWHGSSLFQINDHDGNVTFKKGYLKIQDGRLWGGSFEIDMTTITANDDGPNKGLEKHLKNEDFFEVNKYSNAWLSIQKVRLGDNGKYEVEANLNIKGITKPIIFYAVLESVGTNWHLTTKFIIDRTRWNINYGKNENILDPLKNYSISDAIKFDVEVITN